jgi:hypothetical protein
MTFGMTLQALSVNPFIRFRWSAEPRYARIGATLTRKGVSGFVASPASAFDCRAGIASADKM